MPDKYRGARFDISVLVRSKGGQRGRWRRAGAARIIRVVGSEHGRDDARRLERSRDGRKGRAPEEALAAWPLSAPVRRIAARFAEVVCPPEVRAEGRTDRVIGEAAVLAGGPGRPDQAGTPGPRPEEGR